MMYIASLIWGGLGVYNIMFVENIEIGLTFFILQALALIAAELQRMNHKEK